MPLEGKMLLRPHDHMVEQLNPQRPADLGELFGEDLVRLAPFRCPAGVVMRHDQPGRIVVQRPLDEFSGCRHRRIQRARKQRPGPKAVASAA